jgi:hypothetical protein
MDVLEIMRNVGLGLLILLGTWTAARSWFAEGEVRKLMFWAGLVTAGGATAVLLDHDGSVWRWPARAFLAAAMIVATLQSFRSRSPELRWVVGTGAATMVSLLVLASLSGQMSVAARTTMAVVVVGITLCFVAPMVRVAIGGARNRG